MCNKAIDDTNGLLFVSTVQTRTRLRLVNIFTLPLSLPLALPLSLSFFFGGEEGDEKMSNKLLEELLTSKPGFGAHVVTLITEVELNCVSYIKSSRNACWEKCTCSKAFSKVVAWKATRGKRERSPSSPPPRVV